MNFIWLCIVFIVTIYCLFNGNVSIINDVFLSIGEQTFNFVIPLLCVTCFWNGILYIAKDAGIIHLLEKCFHPLLKRLLPDLSDDEETLGYVVTNVVVNMVGLGSAATPVGLLAMKGMQEHNPDKDIASRSMVTFLVLNTAGVTLLSTTLIAMRSSYHSINVTGFMPYAIVSTIFASVVGLTIDRWWNYRD